MQLREDGHHAQVGKAAQSSQSDFSSQNPAGASRSGRRAPSQTEGTCCTPIAAKTSAMRARVSGFGSNMATTESRSSAL
jgi:hypothetical protein